MSADGAARHCTCQDAVPQKPQPLHSLLDELSKLTFVPSYTMTVAVYRKPMTPAVLTQCSEFRSLKMSFSTT